MKLDLFKVVVTIIVCLVTHSSCHVTVNSYLRLANIQNISRKFASIVIVLTLFAIPQQHAIEYF